ncbi:MAG: alpha/beta hydrolase [Chloroflexota bacterium]|nr:alpha/beta hydrolase [Chloroflexota bacterium]
MPTVAVDGVDLYYEIHGDEAGAPLVFVNGIFQDTTGWSLHVRRFAYRRCLVYDCRGQGRSAKPTGPYLMDRHAADLLGVLDALHVDRADVVGLSSGGAVAMTFAAAHPARVRRLVLVDTFAYADAALRAKLRSWEAALDAGGPGLRFDVSVPWNFSRGFLEDHERDLPALRERALTLDPDAMRALMAGSAAHDARAALSRIAAPTLVLVGEEDVLAPPWVAREIADAIPDAHLQTIAAAGHAMPIERLDEFCDALRTFFVREVR